MATSADPDQMPQNAASDQGLHCLPIVQSFFLGILVSKSHNLTYLNSKLESSIHCWGVHSVYNGLKLAQNDNVFSMETFQNKIFTVQNTAGVRPSVYHKFQAKLEKNAQKQKIVEPLKGIYVQKSKQKVKK